MNKKIKTIIELSFAKLLLCTKPFLKEKSKKIKTKTGIKNTIVLTASIKYSSLGSIRLKASLFDIKPGKIEWMLLPRPTDHRKPTGRIMVMNFLLETVKESI
ncbi:hypothetical protein PPNK14_05240 [Pectobacterium parmentieri]